MEALLNGVPVEVQYRAETAVFVKNYDCLWHGLTSPDEIASKLYSEKLLGDVELDAIQSTAGYYPKNSVILSSLKRGPSGSLLKLCAILKDIPHLNHITKKLEKDMQIEVQKLLKTPASQEVPSSGTVEELGSLATDFMSQQPASHFDGLGAEIAPPLKKLIEFVESEDDITVFEDVIQKSLRSQGFKGSVEISCSKAGDSESESLESLLLKCVLKEPGIEIIVSKTVRKFSQKIAKIIDALHAHEGALERMKDYVTQMHLLQPRHRVAKIISTSVEAAASVREFFRLLGKHWNYIDVDLLIHILEAANCDPALKLLSEFLVNRDSKLPLTELMEEMEKSRSSEDTVCVKVKVNTERITLEEYDTLKSAVTGVLSIPRVSFSPPTISRGCFEVSWEMCAELLHYVHSVRITQSCLQLLARHDVISVTIGDSYHLVVPPLNYWDVDAKVHSFLWCGLVPYYCGEIDQHHFRKCHQIVHAFYFNLINNSTQN